MTKIESILKCWSIAQECIDKGVSVCNNSLYEREQVSFGLGGFSKSGSASLTISCRYGEWYTVLKTRYDSVIDINSFDDIVSEAFCWYDSYKNRSPFEKPDETWVNHWVKRGLLKKVVKTTYKAI